ncbi:MAG: hypothetical protein A2Y79_01690 [Deltaproteobacteria bacterium RBG_13_43_22]|nr:MAG: hypothetical protein A2Y79_01690 [Deltaproteobacteria bacterium RBG_13_43_22]
MPIKYDRILFCTDFSDDADYALLTALEMAKRYQARLYVLHVVHSAYPKVSDGVNESGKDGEETINTPEIIEKGKEKLIELYESKMGELSNPIEFQVVLGVPFVEIVRFARAQNINFIVLGAAGSSNIERITFGSTAENVARRAHCTVMITRNPERVF